MHSSRVQDVNIENQPDEMKCNEGQHTIYYNLHPKLPLNLAMARVVGIILKRPGSKLTFRGNVVVVRSNKWPEPLVMGGGNHTDYVDVQPSLRSTLDPLSRIGITLADWIIC